MHLSIFKSFLHETCNINFGKNEISIIYDFNTGYCYHETIHERK